MKTTIEFNLPEEESEMRYALAGVDALIVISNIRAELRSAWKHDTGRFKSFSSEQIDILSDFITEQEKEYNLPELI
jgi:hypothetical protein